MHQVYTHTHTYTHSTLQLSSVQNRQIVCVWHSMRKAKNNHLHNVYVDWSFRMNRINFDCMVFCEDERKIAIGCKVNALPLEMCQSEFLFPHFQLKYCWWDWMHLCWYISLFFLFNFRDMQTKISNQHTKHTYMHHWQKKWQEKQQQRQQNIESDKKMLYIRVMHKQNVLCSIEVGLRVSFPIDCYCFMCKMVISKQSRYWNI